MASTIFITVITGLVVVFSAIFQYFFSLLELIKKKPKPPTGAVKIDTNEHIYAHPDYTKTLFELSSFEIQTAYDVILRGIRLSGDRPHFSYRQSSEQPFKSYTHNEVFDIIKEIGSGMIKIGLEPTNETIFGIYGIPTMNYAFCLYAAWPYSMVPIGIYDSLGRDGVKFIIWQSGVKLIFADDLQRVKNLIEWKDEKLAFTTIISFVGINDDLQKMAEEKQLNLLTLEKLRDIGRNNPVDVVPPKPTDTAVIMYTSGSTGEPKGCVLTHESFMCGVCAILLSIDIKELASMDTPRVLNYLPLAHVFGSGTIVGLTYVGGVIGFWQGKVDKLIDDFRDFRPTILAMVPRLLNRLYDKVQSEINEKGIFGRTLFQLAISNKMALIRRGNFSKDTIWDRLIFEKVRQSFGGKVNCVVSTGAPLSSEVCKFSRAAFSCTFIECYGQTECVIICSQTKNDTESGETGIPTPATHLKLVDVPEKEYYAKDGIGEVCIKSPTLFKGYLKDEAKTREAVDEAGWLHTGDIGRWTPYQTIKLVDRKKNMYKLSQGEYVAPEKIEDIYGRNQFIAQIFVYGDSLESFLVAIVLLNEDSVKQWALSQRYNVQETKTSKFKKELKRVVLDGMQQEAKTRGLMSFENVKAIEFIDEPFTVENGLLTPTFKSRRYAIEKKYKQLFQKIYEDAKI